MGSLALLVWSWAASAAEPEPPPPPPPAKIGGASRPLAIPGGQDEAGAPPAARPAPYDAVSAKALRDYRANYLSLRPLSEITVGSTVNYGVTAGWGTAGPAGFGGFVSSPTPWIQQNDSVAVFQGNMRLDMPATYKALGDPVGADKLERHIKSNKSGATFLYLIGFGGIAASIGGLIAADNAPTYEQHQQWLYVSWAGVAGTVVGFVGGSLPSARAHRLATDPTASFDLRELQERIDRRNDLLAAQLGLSPAQAVSLEGP